MGIPNKERISGKEELKIKLEKANVFPPLNITYEGIILYRLGVSDDKDLMPVNYSDKEMIRVVTFGRIDQFIYTTKNGDLYDACIYQDESGDIYLYKLRTRQLPEKVKEAKG